MRRCRRHGFSPPWMWSSDSWVARFSIVLLFYLNPDVYLKTVIIRISVLSRYASLCGAMSAACHENLMNTIALVRKGRKMPVRFVAKTEQQNRSFPLCKYAIKVVLFFEDSLYTDQPYTANLQNSPISCRRESSSFILRQPSPLYGIESSSDE